MRSGHVFISYTQRFDSAFANALNVQLSLRPGVFVFQDIHAPAMDQGIARSVFEQVRDADLIVAIVSPQSAPLLADSASWLFQEVDFAHKVGRPVAVVAGEGFAWGQVELPERLAFLKDVRFFRGSTDTVQGVADQLVELLRRGEAARSAATTDARWAVLGDAPQAAETVVVERVGQALSAALRSAPVPVDLTLKLLAWPPRPGHFCVARAVGEALALERSGPLGSLWTQLKGRYEVLGANEALSAAEVSDLLDVVDAVVSIGGEPSVLRPLHARACFGERPRPWLPLPVCVMSADEDASRSLLVATTRAMLAPTVGALSASALDALATSVDGALPRADFLTNAFAQLLAAPDAVARRLDDAQVGHVLNSVEAAEAPKESPGWLTRLVGAGATRLADRATTDDLLTVLQALGASARTRAALAAAAPASLRRVAASLALAPSLDLQRWRTAAVTLAALVAVGGTFSAFQLQRQRTERDQNAQQAAACAASLATTSEEHGECLDENEMLLKNIEGNSIQILEELAELRTTQFGVTLAQLMMSLTENDREVIEHYGVYDWNDLAETLARRDPAPTAPSLPLSEPPSTWWARGVDSNTAIKVVYLPIPAVGLHEVPLSSSSFGDPGAEKPLTRCFFAGPQGGELSNAEEDRGPGTSQCEVRMHRDVLAAAEGPPVKRSQVTCTVRSPDRALICTTLYDTADSRRGGGMALRPAELVSGDAPPMRFAFGHATEVQLSLAHPMYLRALPATTPTRWLRVPASVLDERCVVPLQVVSAPDMGGERPDFATLFATVLATARDFEAYLADPSKAPPGILAPQIARYKAFFERLTLIEKDWDGAPGDGPGYARLTWTQPTWTPAGVPAAPYGGVPPTQPVAAPVTGYFPTDHADVCPAMPGGKELYGGLEWFLAWGHTEPSAH